MNTTITIIEDDNDLRGLLRLSLQTAGYEVRVLTDNGDLANEIKENIADIYIIDFSLETISGLDLCKLLKSEMSHITQPVVIMISGHPDAGKRAAEACADDVLLKPFTVKELLQKIAQYHAQQEVSQPIAQAF